MASEPEFQDETIAVEDASGGLHLEEYWAAIVKRWRLIALCVGIALASAAVYSILSRPVYRASVVIDVEPDRGNPLDIGIGSAPTAYFAIWSESLATTARLMQTRDIAERVVKQLNLVENREFNPPSSGFFRVKRKARAGDDLARMTSKVKASLDAKPVRDVGVSVRDTNLVELSAVASTPQLASDIANAVADAFLAWNLESKYGPAGRASGYLGEQILLTKSELDDKTQQLLAYGKEKDIVSTDPGTLYNSKIGLDLDTAVADRVAKEAR